MTASDAPTVLVFDGAKTAGAYLVRDGNGTPIARIRSGWSGSSFTVTGADGLPLVSGRRGLLFATTWTTVDAQGQPLVVFKPLRKRRRGDVSDGRTARIKGRWMVDDWSLLDGVGRTAVSSTPMRRSWIFGARPWAVQINDPAFTVAEVIALVESHRLALKARESAAPPAALS